MKRMKHKRGFYKYKKTKINLIIPNIPGIENNWFKRHKMGLNRYNTIRIYWERNFDKLMKRGGCRW